MTLDVPPIGHQSKGHTASYAHIRDILNIIFKLDRDDLVFFVESSIVARFPRLNAECLNVIAIDHRTADLNEHFFHFEVRSLVVQQ